MKHTPRAGLIRRALGLAQEEFVAGFQIPVGTLREWEQGTAEPDQAARAYLKVIARDPEAVRRPRSLISSSAAQGRLTNVGQRARMVFSRIRRVS